MAALLRRSAHHLLRPAQPNQQQLRFAGDLPVKPSKYVEDWALYRENVEYYFKWDRKTWTRLGFALVAFPYGVYSITCAEFDKTDRKYGREPRDFMGDVKKR